MVNYVLRDIYWVLFVDGINISIIGLTIDVSRVIETNLIVSKYFISVWVEKSFSGSSNTNYDSLL